MRFNLDDINPEATEEAIKENDNSPFSKKNKGLIEDAKAIEEVSKEKAKTTLRDHVVKMAKWFLTGVLIFVLLVMLVYLVTLVAEPFDERVIIIKNNFQKLFYKIFELFPWVLLFLFGDTAKIKAFLKSQNGH